MNERERTRYEAERRRLRAALSVLVGLELRLMQRFRRSVGEQPEPASLSTAERDPGAEFWWARRWNGSDC